MQLYRDARSKEQIMMVSCNKNAIDIYIQGVPGGCARFRESVPYVKVYRYNPKTPTSKVERLRR